MIYVKQIYVSHKPSLKKCFTTALNIDYSVCFSNIKLFHKTGVILLTPVYKLLTYLIYSINRICY